MGAQDEVAPPEVCQRVLHNCRMAPRFRREFIWRRATVLMFPTCLLTPGSVSEVVGYNAAADAAAAREVEQFLSRKTD